MLAPINPSLINPRLILTNRILLDRTHLHLIKIVPIPPDLTRRHLIHHDLTKFDLIHPPPLDHKEEATPGQDPIHQSIALHPLRNIQLPKVAHSEATAVVPLLPK